MLILFKMIESIDMTLCVISFLVYFYFPNENCNISPGAVTGGNLINLAAVEKTKRKNIIELQYCTGMSRREIQKYTFFFSIFKKLGWEGRKTKNKTRGPMVL